MKTPYEIFREISGGNEPPNVTVNAMYVAQAETWEAAAKIIEAQDGMVGFKRRIASTFRAKASACREFAQ